MSSKSKPAPEPKPIRFRDRIRELRRVAASTLIDNTKNWRKHPEEQVGAMTSMLDKLGFVGALVARETSAGLELLDGHLRKSLAADDLVPVLIVDLSDEEADLMLATFDPLSELAVMDSELLRTLLEGVEDDDAFLRRLMADASDEAVKEAKDAGEDVKDVPGMALEPHEHYDYLVVMAQTSHEWNVLCDRLQLSPETGRRGRIGTARAIRAARLIERLPPK